MMRGKLPVIFDSAPAALAALVLASALAPATHAQTRDARTATPSTATQSPTPRPRDAQTPRAAESEESGAEPDLSITARVTADSLRFEKVPNPNVEFTGKPRRETVWQSERQNLPQQVQPGVTYRDIGITLRITSVFADIDRIVAEALGEVPASDGAQPASAPPTRPAPPAQPYAQPQATSETQESRTATTPSPAKASTRANARARHERRGRGR